MQSSSASSIACRVLASECLVAQKPNAEKGAADTPAGRCYCGGSQSSHKDVSHVATP